MFVFAVVIDRDSSKSLLFWFSPMFKLPQLSMSLLTATDQSSVPNIYNVLLTSVEASSVKFASAQVGSLATTLTV